MANYKLVASGVFQPFSLDRYLQPLTKYAEAYEKMESNLNSLAEKTNSLADLKNDQFSKNAYKIYEDYQNRLSDAADDLAKGLSIDTSTTLNNLFREYRKSITPLEETRKFLDERKEQQMKLKLADPTMWFDNDYSSLGIDDLIRNPLLKQYTGLSGNQISKEAAEDFKYAAQQLSDARIEGNLDSTTDAYLTEIEKSGYSLEAVLMAAQNDPKAPEELKKLSQSIHKRYRSHSAYNFEKVNEAINRGMLAAVGSIKKTKTRHPNYMSEKEKSKQDDDIKYIKQSDGSIIAITKDANGNPVATNINIQESSNPVPTPDNGDPTDQNAAMLDALDSANSSSKSDEIKRKAILDQFNKQYGLVGKDALYSNSVKNYLMLTDEDHIHFKATQWFGHSDASNIELQDVETFDDFDPKDAKKVDWSKISDSRIMKIREWVNSKLLKNGGVSTGAMKKLFDIYLDSDFINNNEYVIVKHTDVEEGTPYNARLVKPTEQPKTPTQQNNEQEGDDAPEF